MCIFDGPQNLLIDMDLPHLAGIHIDTIVGKALEPEAFAQAMPGIFIRSVGVSAETQRPKPNPGIWKG